MKYFTAKLYARINDNIDEAEHEWDRRTRQYRNGLEKIIPQLPDDMVKFLNEGLVHDAEVLSALKTREYNSDQDCFQIICHQHNWVEQEYLYIFNYKLKEPNFTHKDHSGEIFNKDTRDWLYDEVNMVNKDEKIFSHSILLSSGEEITIYFTDFKFQKYTLKEEPT